MLSQVKRLFYKDQSIIKSSILIWRKQIMDSDSREHLRISTRLKSLWQRLEVKKISILMAGMVPVTIAYC